MMNYNERYKKACCGTVPLLCLGLGAGAQPVKSSMENPLAITLMIVIFSLLIAIVVLANVVVSATGLYRNKMKKENEESSSMPGGTILMLLVLLGLSSPVFAQTDANLVPQVAKNISGLSPAAFYSLCAVIALEVLILLALSWQLKVLVGIESNWFKAKKRNQVNQVRENWWWRINRSVKAEDEKAIDLSHDYDGISELDNKMPPWWLAAFAATVIFSGVYMWRYHVAHSAPLQIEELEIAIRKGEEEKAEYLAKTASNVDERNVVLLDESGIAMGKTLFAANCVACHGTEAQGGAVGPNLTDEYWLHGGTLNDVFRTIKYGVVEKGMRSWKEDLSPIQMAQLASYIHSVQGSRPPNARAPQGEKLETDASAASSTDSSTNAPTQQ